MRSVHFTLTTRTKLHCSVAPFGRGRASLTALLPSPSPSPIANDPAVARRRRPLRQTPSSGVPTRWNRHQSAGVAAAAGCWCAALGSNAPWRAWTRSSPLHRLPPPRSLRSVAPCACFAWGSCPSPKTKASTHRTNREASQRTMQS